MQKHTIINIGRQFGSGGKSVAMALSKLLCIPAYDNELLIEAARESGYSKELFEGRDEKRSVFTLSGIFASSTRFGLTESYINDNELFRIQSEVIRDIAGKGPAIFVGRASDYVLRDFKCLDVFITAPLDDRKKRVAERMGISEDDAAAFIQKQDRDRKSYYDYFTFGEWGVASNYDLCVDSSILGIEGTAEMIVEFGKKAGFIL